jgi:hypothetical protein
VNKGEKEEVEREEEGEKIRYIRDWTNGNNRNRASHWIEIQAIDKE